MIQKTILILAITLGCQVKSDHRLTQSVSPGAYQMSDYLDDLENKKIGVTVNHSSMIEQTHLVDTLIQLGVNLKKVFTPEHGFKGTVSDGVEIEYASDSLPYELISLYGKNKKPSLNQLDSIDVMLFDIQDVGARFYTYLSTMHYVMEACAQKDIPVIVLDRPNPNGSYIDGPIMDTTFSSFVGMHPVPIVYGMTIGEYAQMINGEGWLANGISCELSVVKLKNWTHDTPYSLPLKPSPNLPNDLSISLYPSLCLFEGTIVSVGRGTDSPFQHIGHPNYPDSSYSFTPISMEGAKWPPLENQTCFGISFLDEKPLYQFNLTHLINMYQRMDTSGFFNAYFKRLAGTDQLQKQIESGMSEQAIRQTWESDLENFKSIRNKYLLYD